MNFRFLKDLSLLIAGALAGLLSSLFIEKNLRINVLIVTGILFLGFSSYGLSIIDKIILNITRFNRSIRKKRCKLIGIINDMNWNENDIQITSWTHVDISTWIKKIKNREKNIISRIKVNKVLLNKKIEKYNYIINPYGGVYPEKDTIKKINLDLIMNYVAEGGVFINVSDVPGYWMYNLLLKTKVESAPNKYSLNDKLELKIYRPFGETPFMEKLAINIINVTEHNNIFNEIKINNKIFNIVEVQKYKTDRIAVINNNIEPYITFIGNNGYNFSPFFKIPYGKGYFIINLYFLDKLTIQNIDIVDKLIDIIIND